MGFSVMVKIALKRKNGATGLFKFLNIWILRLNYIVNYTMKCYRKILAIKAQHSSNICWLMFMTKNLVPNFISAHIYVETAVLET